MAAAIASIVRMFPANVVSPNAPWTGKHRHHSARGQQSEERQEQLDQRGDDRAVDDQQHACDRDEGEQGDLSEAGVADDVQIVGERGRACDVSLDPWRGFGVLDDLADGLNAFVGQRLALFAGEVQHHVGGLAVGALRPAAVKVSPQKSWMCWMCSGSCRSLRMISS